MHAARVQSSPILLATSGRSSGENRRRLRGLGRPGDERKVAVTHKQPGLTAREIAVLTVNGLSNE